MEPGRPKRFLKDRSNFLCLQKLPPSGGKPAYKLTLPHQMVQRYLLHLLDTDFELAASASAAQTWQGSLVSRRNKERSEYLLQGWKLFAEAHNIRAGDQISFELVGQTRLVLQVVTPVQTLVETMPPRRSMDTSALDFSPMKSLKCRSSTSPSRSTSLPKTNENPHLWFEDCLKEDTLIDELWSDMPADEQEGPQEVPKFGGQTLDGTEPFNVEASSEAWLAEADAEAQPVAEVPAPLALQASVTPQTPTRSHLSKISCDTTSPDAVPILESLIDKEMLLARNLSRHSQLGEQPHMAGRDKSVSESLDSSTGSFMRSGWMGQHFTSTINTLQHEAQDLHTKASKSEDEAQHFKALLSSMQSKVDRQVREALRATIGLEECMSSLKAYSLNSERVLQTQSSMTSHIATLKEKIWQMLVLSMSDDVPP